MTVALLLLILASAAYSQLAHLGVIKPSHFCMGLALGSTVMAVLLLMERLK